MRIVGRIILLPIAFVLAALATGGVLALLGQEKLAVAFSAGKTTEASIGAIWDLLKMGRALFSIETLLPTLLIIIAGEVARIRSSLYYVIGGGLALLAVPFIARLGDTSVLKSTATLWQVFATAGFAGGFVYWLVAGRRA